VKRTHLPLNGLRVLDAAARHLSFTRAADELAVTPAAVGQQIRALEDTLGVVLFRRTTRGLELTPEAEAGLGALRGGFLQFEEAVRAMQAGQSSKSLTIAAPRDLTEKWLMPRLADVAQRDGELRFVLLSADDTVDFTEANLDLAIRWGEGPGEHEGEALESEGMVTIAAPGAGEAVIGWPGSPGGDGSALVRVADAGLAIDAAVAGLGRATVSELLAAREIAAGKVIVIGDPQPSRLGYWLVAPLPQWRQAKVRALVDALTA
jgi:LysR family glycine cleavage system transcriptional activator